jgi:hypothetical protein
MRLSKRVSNSIVNLTSEVLNTMHVQRAIAGTFVTVSVIVLAAIGQHDRSHEEENAQAQVTNCQTAMPVIFKQYNNARYAVQAARNSGDRGHILDEVNQAQAALDAMEEPIKVCSEAMQNMKSGQPRDGTN